MRFPDVNAQKLNFLVILLIDVLEAHGPLDERWSSVTTKDQGHRLLAPKLGEGHSIRSAAVGERKIGSHIASLRRLPIQLLLNRHKLSAVLDDLFGAVEQF